MADSLENWHGVDRHHFNAVISEQDLAETYFPAFISCANRGNASGLMCSCKWALVVRPRRGKLSYFRSHLPQPALPDNAVNGVPSCASKDLLTDKMRNSWGLDAYITSDW